MLKEITNTTEKQIIARDILYKLPQWFGIPESTEEYINESKNMPFFAYFDDEKAVGFISLKETSPYTCEIFVTGILAAYHRKGIGTQLWKYFCNYAKNNGYEYVQVKTVKKGCYPQYNISNRFYESLGFREMECFPELWDKNNPCQIYIKKI